MHGVLLSPTLKKQREFIQGPINVQFALEKEEGIIGEGTQHSLKADQHSVRVSSEFESHRIRLEN